MPQASDERRETMNRFFGDPIDDSRPIAFLESHGFELLKGWTWKKPTPSHNVSADEFECLCFLIEEWDFGVWS